MEGGKINALVNTYLHRVSDPSPCHAASYSSKLNRKLQPLHSCNSVRKFADSVFLRYICLYIVENSRIDPNGFVASNMEKFLDSTRES